MEGETLLVHSTTAVKEAVQLIDPKQLKPWRPAQAKCRQLCHSMHSEPKESKFGPPDKAANFKTPNKRQMSSASILLQAQRKVTLNLDKFVANPYPEVIGKQVRMKF